MLLGHYWWHVIAAAGQVLVILWIVGLLNSPELLVTENLDCYGVVSHPRKKLPPLLHSELLAPVGQELTTAMMVGDQAKFLRGPPYGGSAGPSCLSQPMDAGGGVSLNCSSHSQEELLSPLEVVPSRARLACKRLIIAFQPLDLCHQGPGATLKASNFLSGYVGINKCRNPVSFGFHDVSAQSGEVGPSFYTAILLMSCGLLVLLSLVEIHEGVPEFHLLACVIQSLDNHMILCSFNHELL